MFKNNKTPFVVIILSLLSLLTLSGKESQGDWQWGIDDLITPDTVGEYQLSPGGQKLLWTLKRWNVEEHKTYHILYLTHISGNHTDQLKRIQLTRGEYSIYSIQWVPGGEKISFITSRTFEDTKEYNIWVMNINGGEPYPVTSFASGVQMYRWLDENSILFLGQESKSLYEKEKKDARNTARVVEDEDHQKITRLFKYNLQNKQIQRFTNNIKPITNFYLSNSKKWVIFKTNQSLRFEVDQKIHPKYYLKNLEGDISKEIIANDSWGHVGFRWATDDSGYYMLRRYSSHPKYIFAYIIKIYWQSLNSDQYEEINLQWDRYASSYIFSPTANGFVVALLNGVHYKYARFYNKGKGNWKREWIKGDLQQNIFYIHMAKDLKTMVYNYSTASQPPRYYLAELKGNQFLKKKEVMDIQSPLFKKPLTKSEIIQWEGARGDKVEGILYYPINYKKEKKYPLILLIRGGPFSADMDNFNCHTYRPTHFLAEHGAFVFRVNYHGSLNYGLEFAESIAGHYYEYEIQDIEKGEDFLISQGKVDENRLGVMGWSNGSILGTQLIIQSHRYKAASLGAGVINWISDYGNCAFGVSFDNYYIGGPPWENIKTYIEKSPFFQLKKITTPVLIFHSEEDRDVPYEQSWQYYRALQQIGKVPVRFITFPGKGHFPLKLAHQRAKLKEEFQWFEKYLFNTYHEKNESLKKNSPLDKLKNYLEISKHQGCFGIEKNGILIPETVKFKQLYVGRFEVTQAQWAEFDKKFQLQKGFENHPITGVSFKKIQQYIQWLNQITGNSYRLPKETEENLLYHTYSGNIFDYWAGYTLNPDDYQNLKKELVPYNEHPVLLKPVGSFNSDEKNFIFDLGGNAAEWVMKKDGTGKACGGSADRPKDKKSTIQPQKQYIGFRIIKENR